MHSTQRYYRLNPRQIAFLKFIFEAYDGIAVVTTIEPKAGLVGLQIPPGCEDAADSVVESLKGLFPINRVDPVSAARFFRSK